MRLAVAVALLCMASPAFAGERLPVDKINAAFKGHVWTFPLDGQSTSLAFAEFKHEHGKRYAIYVDVK